MTTKIACAVVAVAAAVQFQPLPVSAAIHNLQQIDDYASTGPNTGVGCAPLFSAVGSTNTTAKYNRLESVAVLSPSDAWAVGTGYTTVLGGISTGHTLAEHWNGSSWATVATPDLSPYNNSLSGVAAIDSNNVWAVGSWSGVVDNNASSNNLVLHWNGTVWSSIATPQPSTTTQYLTAVSAIGPNDIWAVGSYSNGVSYVNESMHWNGISWTSVPMPSVATSDNTLVGVFGLGPNDVWATGYYLGSSVQDTLIEHWDGTAWSLQASPSPSLTANNQLHSITATSATDAWAVGFSGSSTLTLHLVSGTWTLVSSPNPDGFNALFGVDAISPTNIWATGFAGSAALATHWDGSTWTVASIDSPLADNVLQAVASLAGGEVWAVGWGANSLPDNSESTLIEHFQLPAPTGVSATPSDQSATVTWTPPSCDGGFTTTGYVVTASDGCTILASMPATSSPLTFTGLSNGSPVSFTVQAVSAALGAETPSAPSARIVPTGVTAPTAESACSGMQYSLHAPSGTTFSDVDAAKLALAVTPSASSLAVISGNADLWTADAGINQDLGVLISGGSYGAGQVVGWKESGGLAGTFSPNAAAVQTVIPLDAGITYTVKLQWKANKSAPTGTIFAGAGPLHGDFRFTGSPGFSPTRLSVHLAPAAGASVTSAFSSKQYRLVGNDGTTFRDMDSINLTLPITPATDSMAVITANADLWTANPGYNQDIGINVDGSVVSWKESGGSAGTFSPNAAFVQAVVPLAMVGSPHSIKLQWKSNKSEGNAAIYAGAGAWPVAGTFSPTRLTVWLLPAGKLNAAVSTMQFHLGNSDGAGWVPIDTTSLQVNVAPGTTTSYIVSCNVDLWTATSGINQDVGIFISGGIYGNGTLLAWKESGGSAGTFSPNAAYVEAVAHLPAGSYAVWLAWKTNKPASGGSIYASAGPWPPLTTTYSPTRLTAAEVSSP